MPSIDSIKASDGSGPAALMTIQSVRAPLSSTISVDTVAGVGDNFIATMGTPDAETGIITNATATDFFGHVDGANLEIDSIAPGFTDLGSSAGDVVVIKPTTAGQDELAEILEVSHNDDGTLKEASILSALTENAILGTVDDERGVLGAIHTYTYDGTDIFVDGVDQDNAANTIDWTKPTGIKFAIIEVQGGGGGGGAGPLNGGSGSTAGAGGGGGGYALAKVDADDLGSTETVTVGAGGGGGASGTGTVGGTSSFGTHAVAAGGNGGPSTSGSGKVTGGVSGGLASAGDIQVAGGAGGYGIALDSDSANSGNGGDSRFGGGGRSVASNGAVDITGIGGKGYGAGGGGGINFDNGTAAHGGSGTAGIVIVYEYF